MSFGDLELHGHFEIFFLGVNRSGPKTSSTTNHKFYRALGQLQGPWCNNPYVNYLIQILFNILRGVGAEKKLYILSSPIWMLREIKSNKNSFIRYYNYARCTYGRRKNCSMILFVLKLWGPLYGTTYSATRFCMLCWGLQHHMNSNLIDVSDFPFPPLSCRPRQEVVNGHCTSL